MESFLSVGATERISLFRLLQCNLGAIVSLFIPHGAKLVGSRKKKKKLSNRDTERSKAKCRGRAANTVHVGISPYLQPIGCDLFVDYYVPFVQQDF